MYKHVQQISNIFEQIAELCLLFNKITIVAILIVTH